MSPSQANLSPYDSRLMRVLSTLAQADVEVSHANFTERLGRLIDFSGSIALLAMHNKLPATPFESRTVSLQTVQTELLRVHAALVTAVMASFQTGAGSARIMLPQANRDTALKKLLNYALYQRFYAAHQAEFEFRVQGLRSLLRDAMSGVSPALAQLAVLDATLNDTLLLHSRALFAVIPKLLGKRFDYLVAQHLLSQAQQGEHANDDNPHDWLQPGAWLSQFYSEMRDLLLAELEMRLQPVFGLFAALNNEVERDL